MKRTIVGLTLVSALFASTCLGQACSAPDNAITCRRMNVTLNPSSALNSSLFVFQADPDPQPNCQDSQWRLDVVVCLDAPNATLPYILELALPAAHKAIELRVEVRGTMPNQPLRLKIRGANGLDGPPADDYNRAELYELAIHPDSDVHVELTGWLSNFGRIECARVSELVLLNDVAESSGSNYGQSNEKIIGAGLNSLPPPTQ